MHHLRGSVYGVAQDPIGWLQKGEEDLWCAAYYLWWHVLALFLHADCFVISNRGRLLGITDLKITKQTTRSEERRNKRGLICNSYLAWLVS